MERPIINLLAQLQDYFCLLNHPLQAVSAISFSQCSNPNTAPTILHKPLTKFLGKAPSISVDIMDDCWSILRNYACDMPPMMIHHFVAFQSTWSICVFGTNPNPKLSMTLWVIRNQPQLANLHADWVLNRRVDGLQPLSEEKYSLHRHMAKRWSGRFWMPDDKQHPQSLTHWGGLDRS